MCAVPILIRFLFSKTFCEVRYNEVDEGGEYVRLHAVDVDQGAMRRLKPESVKVREVIFSHLVPVYKIHKLLEKQEAGHRR